MASYWDVTSCCSNF